MRDRLLARVSKDANGCWLWSGPKDTCGYGKIRIGSRTDNTRRTVGTHRASWEAFVGPIPSGLYVCHKCDVRDCVNPDHLFLGSHLDNMRDAAQKGRFYARPTRISDDICRRVVELAKSNTRRSIAKDLGISPTMVTMIVNGKSRTTATKGSWKTA